MHCELHLYLRQFDVKTAFLYGDLKEDIWMTQVPGLIQDLTRKDTLEATTIGCDNQSAVKLSKNPEFHWRSKHIMPGSLHAGSTGKGIHQRGVHSDRSAASRHVNTEPGWSCTGTMSGVHQF